MDLQAFDDMGPRVTQFANLLIFLTTILAFHFLWGELLRLYHRINRQDNLLQTAGFSDREFWILGYVLFLFFHLNSLPDATPDTLLSTLVYLASGLILKIRRQGPNSLSYCLLGLVLGLGFLTKAILLPLAVVFLATAALSAVPRRRGKVYSLLGALVFAGIAGAYGFGLSRAKGQFSLGEAGYLNYAWHVNRASFLHWQGELPGLGKPEHPTRKIYSSPPIYEFASPISATFPPWYDPAYWNQGLRIRFRPSDQFAASWKALREYVSELRSQVILIVGVSVLLLVRPDRRTLLRESLDIWYVWIPALAAFLLYGLIWVEDRYVAQFFVLFWAAALILVRLPVTKDCRRLIRTVTVVVATLLSLKIAYDFRQNISVEHSDAKFQMQMARGLVAKGIGSGENIAVLDAGMGVEWQKLLRVHIVAEIPSGHEAEFWAADTAKRAQIYEILGKTGPRFLVASQIPDWASTTGWDRIDGTPAYVFYLNK